MSKGHGRVMRQVLDAVCDEWTLVIHLAADLDRRTLGKRTIGRARKRCVVPASDWPTRTWSNLAIRR